MNKLGINKGRERKIRRSPGRLNFHRRFRNRAVNEYFPPIRLSTGLEVKQ